MTVTRSVILVWLSLIPTVANSQDEEIPRGFPPINVKFPGGSLADYVKALKEASPNSNIALAVPEAKEIRLPAIQLDSVTLNSAIALLEGEYTLDDQSIVKILIGNWGGPPWEAANPVHKIRSERHHVRKPPAQVRVWSIGDLFLGDRKAEQVLTAVETAVGLLKDLPPAQIRYHAETTLLVASGSDEQLAAIERTVDGIRTGVRSEREYAAAIGGTEAVAGLFDWVERMRQFDAQQEEKSRTPDQVAAKIDELTQLLENVQSELQKRDRKIQELERRLLEKERK